MDRQHSTFNSIASSRSDALFIYDVVDEGDTKTGTTSEHAIHARALALLLSLCALHYSD